MRARSLTRDERLLLGRGIGWVVRIGYGCGVGDTLRSAGDAARVSHESLAALDVDDRREAVDRFGTLYQ